MALTPDRDGFAAAQERKRRLLGEPIEFYSEVMLTFPPGTPMDPETGEPYDAFLEPTGSAQTTASASASVAYRPAVDSGQDTSPAGYFDRTHVLLILDQVGSATASGMHGFTWRGEDYKITAQKPDVGWMRRWLVWGRRT